MSDSIPEKQLEEYYRKEPGATRKAILSFLRDSRNPKMVVFGGQALNAHLPDWLDRDTKDWDIVTVGNAESLAGKLEKMLDERYAGDYFSVEPAIHEGTFRIRSKVTGDVVADITLQDKTIEFKKIQGVNYASLEFLEDEAERLVGNPEAAFRRRKDTDTLQRIKVFRASKKRKRSSGGGFRYFDEESHQVGSIR